MGRPAMGLRSARRDERAGADARAGGRAWRPWWSRRARDQFTRRFDRRVVAELAAIAEARGAHAPSSAALDRADERAPAPPMAG